MALPLNTNTTRYDAATSCSSTPRATQSSSHPQLNPSLQTLVPFNITDPTEEDEEYQDALASATPIVPQALLDAALKMPPLEGWPSACDALLKIPKIALMFLTPGRLPHERVWRALIKGVTGAIPVPFVHEYSRNGWFGSLRFLRLRALQHACGQQASNRELSIVDRQFLFSVYVHHHPRFAGYRIHSMFRDRSIPVLMDARRYGWWWWWIGCLFILSV